MGDLGDRGSEVPGWVKHPIFKALVVAGLVMGALSPVLLKVIKDGTYSRPALTGGGVGPVRKCQTPPYSLWSPVRARAYLFSSPSPHASSVGGKSES